MVGAIHQMEDIPSEPEKCLARRCGLHAVRLSGQESRAGIMLKDLDSPAGGRRCDAEPVCRTRDAF